MKPLQGKVAVVAGATRGAGRGIAAMLGEAGATVYCTGRSVRGRPATPGRPGSIDDTADEVNARGGKGVAVPTDHTVEEQVAALFDRARAERGRLDVLVNNVNGDDFVEMGKPFWELSPAKGLEMMRRSVFAHALTSRYAVPLMLGRNAGLVVEVTDRDFFGYAGELFFDLCKLGAVRLAYAMAMDLRGRGVTALALAPGYLRSEEVLAAHGVTEANWRDAVARDPF